MLIENSPSPLQPEVEEPFDKAGKVSFGLDILYDARILGPFLKQGLVTFLVSCFLMTAGARATFFPLVFFPSGILGGWRGSQFFF